MALLNLVYRDQLFPRDAYRDQLFPRDAYRDQLFPRDAYRDQLFPRDAYRQTFERLLEKLPEKSACRIMVDLLALAHERGCEAELAAILAKDLAANQLPDMAVLREQFAPDPAILPEVAVILAPLSDYEELLGENLGAQS
jgi:hypothetical protein